MTRLSAADEERVHRLWMRLAPQYNGSRPHHSDILGLAVRRLEQEVDGSAVLRVKSELGALVKFQQSLQQVSFNHREKD